MRYYQVKIYAKVAILIYITTTPFINLENFYIFAWLIKK